MVRKRKPKAEDPIDPLDAEPYRSMFAHTREAVHRSLARYGEPTMSRAELRRRVDEALGSMSLAEWVEKEGKLD